MASDEQTRTDRASSLNRRGIAVVLRAVRSGSSARRPRGLDRNKDEQPVYAGCPYFLSTTGNDTLSTFNYPYIQYPLGGTVYRDNTP
jgi:hypothetical protein